MASTFKFHSQVGEVVPFNAQYTFPNQATKISKQIVKLPAKNGSDFKEGSTIRIEFPADDYLNVTNSYLTFDAVFTAPSATRCQWQRGGAQNAIKRLRILYGSLVLEDIQEYKTLVRIFSEAAIPQDYRESSGGILDGMSANTNTEEGATAYYGAGYSGRGDLKGIAQSGTDNTITIAAPGSLGGDDTYDNATITLEHRYKAGVAPYALVRTELETRTVVKSDGFVLTVDTPWTIAPATIPGTWPAPNPNTETWYTISFNTNPITPEAVVAGDISLGGPAYSGDNRRRTYCLNLMSGLLTQKKLIPLKWMAAQLAIEITVAPMGEAALYDSTTGANLMLYNPQFVAELLSFDSTYDVAFYAGLQSSGVALKFSSWHFHSFNVAGTSNTVQIHERSRSIKSAFAVIRDSEARIGQKDTDKFFHATGQTYEVGGAITATSRDAAPITEFQWRVGGRYYPAQPVRCTYGAAEAYVELMKAVGRFADYTTANAINIYNWSTWGSGAAYGDKFIMASEFENADVMQGAIAGINGEEQSDLALTFKTSTPMAANRTLDVFVHYDSMIVVRVGNVVDLIM